MNFQGRDEQNFLNGLHNALGVDSWSHADFSVITGLRKNRTDDKSQLATAAASYVRDPGKQTHFYDRVFLDTGVPKIQWTLFRLRRCSASNRSGLMPPMWL